MMWLVLAGVILWLVFLDREEHNPFTRLFWYRLVVVGLLVITVLLGFRVRQWNRDQRQLLLDIRSDIVNACR